MPFFAAPPPSPAQVADVSLPPVSVTEWKWIAPRFQYNVDGKYQDGMSREVEQEIEPADFPHETPPWLFSSTMSDEEANRAYLSAYSLGEIEYRTHASSRESSDDSADIDGIRRVWTKDDANRLFSPSWKEAACVTKWHWTIPSNLRSAERYFSLPPTEKQRIRLVCFAGFSNTSPALPTGTLVACFDVENGLLWQRILPVGTLLERRHLVALKPPVCGGACYPAPVAPRILLAFADSGNSVCVFNLFGKGGALLFFQEAGSKVCKVVLLPSFVALKAEAAKRGGWILRGNDDYGKYGEGISETFRFDAKEVPVTRVSEGR